MNMAYREKIAWLELAGQVVAYGGFFAAVIVAERMGGVSLLLFIGLFAAASVIRMLIEGVGRFVIAARSGADARVPADERDRAIARRGAAIAYYVLMAGMILVGLVMPFTASGMKIVSAALLGLVLAELVRCSIIVSSYRRGWHG
ncbi:MAG: hypothetical protein QOD42_1410 [Sphingomonadales bacterium]|jgi:hypothetical protein|nr:hypothetical protein [Sphingomonadales bacterium]